MYLEVVLEVARRSDELHRPVFVRADLARMSVECEPVPARYRYMGGRQLTSRLLVEEVPAACDPLGAENQAIVAPGALSHRRIPCSGRTSIGAKSPLTGGIKESNVGGTASHSLSGLGIKALIIKGGRPDGGPFVLRIGRDKISVLKADSLAGMSNYRTVEALVGEFGAGASVLSVGPAGEGLLPMATVAVTDGDGRPSRHAGRGGLGAVLASKGVKAIVVERASADPPGFAASERLRDIVRDWAVGLRTSKQTMTKYGTANLVLPVNALGGLPTRNFSQGQFEGAEAISGGALAQLLASRGGRTGHPCHPGCAIRCSNVYVDPNGSYVTSGLEYETIGLLGSNCGVSDLDTIAAADRRCDDIGLDTMETGATLGIAMEAGVAEFGDGEALLHLIDEIARGSEIGRILGQGASAAGKVLGVARIPVVKGQAMSAYDPRAFKGTGVTYATSPMGADHTAGNCLPGRGGLHDENRSGLDGHSPDNQWRLSQDVQILTTICDILGICFFVGTTPSNLEVMASLFSLVTDRSWSVRDLLQAARDTLKAEQAFNRMAGIGGTPHNRIPDFFRTEPLPPTGLVFDVPQQDLDAAAAL